MREMRSACSVFSCRAPKTILEHAKMSVRWLCELFEQERALQGRHADPESKVGEVAETGDQKGESVVYGDPRLVKQSRAE